MSTLKERFEELIHLPWDEFVEMEKDKTPQSMIWCYVHLSVVG